MVSSFKPFSLQNTSLSNGSRYGISAFFKWVARSFRCINYSECICRCFEKLKGKSCWFDFLKTEWKLMSVMSFWCPKIQKAIAIYKKLWYNNQGKALFYRTFQNTIKHYKTAFLFLKEIICYFKEYSKAPKPSRFSGFFCLNFCFGANLVQKIKLYQKKFDKAVKYDII